MKKNFGLPIEEVLREVEEYVASGKYNGNPLRLRSDTGEILKIIIDGNGKASIEPESETVH